MRAVEKVNAVHAGQAEIGGDESDLLPVACQALEVFEPGLRRVGRKNLIVRAEAVAQCRLGPAAGLLVGVRQEQHGGTVCHRA